MFLPEQHIVCVEALVTRSRIKIDRKLTFTGRLSKMVFWSFCLVTFLQLLLSIISWSTVHVEGGQDFICNTPTKWLADAAAQLQSRNHHSAPESGMGDMMYYSDNLFWPGGIVKYEFDSTLTQSDIAEVNKAFAEYETKTCVRFKRRTPGEKAFTRIKVNDSDCGLADVCHHGKEQFTSFGQHCRVKSTMVHELGHTLCLLHEHQRPDRGEYVYPGPYPAHTDVNREISGGLYNYYSIMHYQCTRSKAGVAKIRNVNKCGTDAVNGLSPLDVDTVNKLYNCRGCFGHRWESVSSVAALSNQEVVRYGDWGRDVRLPCRGYGIPGEIGSGTYFHQKKTCEIASGGGSISSLRGDKAYVLKLPSALTSGSGHGFYLKKVTAGQKLKEWDGQIHAGIGMNGNGIGLIAVINENWYDVVFGKVWLSSDGVLGKAEFPLQGSQSSVSEFKILACRHPWQVETSGTSDFVSGSESQLQSSGVRDDNLFLTWNDNDIPQSPYRESETLRIPSDDFGEHFHRTEDGAFHQSHNFDQSVPSQIPQNQAHLWQMNYPGFGSNLGNDDSSSIQENLQTGTSHPGASLESWDPFGQSLFASPRNNRRQWDNGGYETPEHAEDTGNSYSFGYGQNFHSEHFFQGGSNGGGDMVQNVETQGRNENPGQGFFQHPLDQRNYNVGAEGELHSVDDFNPHFSANFPVHDGYTSSQLGVTQNLETDQSQPSSFLMANSENDHRYDSGGGEYETGQFQSYSSINNIGDQDNPTQNWEEEDFSVFYG